MDITKGSLKANEALVLMDYEKGDTLKAIGKKYGVSSQAVSAFLKRRGLEIKPQNTSSAKYSFNEHWLDELDSQEKWYFLGFMYADGNVDTHNSNYRIRIKLKANDSEKELLEKFRELLECEKELEYAEKKNNTYDTIEKSYTFYVANKHFCMRLIELGCVENKTLVLKFPDFIPDKFLTSFIRGYFDGDGSLLLRNDGNLANIRILGTEDMMTKLSSIVKKEIGVTGIVAKYGDKKVWKYDIANQRDIKTFCDWMYKDSSICLKRKYENYLTFINTRDFTKETKLEIKERLEREFPNILERYRNGDSKKKLGRDFNCSDHAIALLLSRHNIT